MRHADPAPPGAVDVFRPRALGWSLALLGTPLFLAAYFVLVPEPILPRWAGAVIVALDAGMGVVLFRRRRRHRIELSTEGLRVVDERGSRAVAWANVGSADRVGTDEDERLVLTTRDGARVVVDLDGYDEASRAVIRRRVRDCASATRAAASSEARQP